jgi:pyruvate/oxaloacetate carboxyltransferase
MQLEETLEQIKKAMKALLTEPVGKKPVKITDLTPRDGQQCKLATRVTTDDLLPLCAALDKCGFYAVEVWGGATFDVCLRYLREDPWERLRRMKAVMPRTKLQMLLRGQHILGYRPYTDRIVGKFVERAIGNGINVFRVFEAINDFRNLETAAKIIYELGGEVHVEVNYTVSPVHTFAKWMEYAEQLLEFNAHWLCLKDATGIIMPFDAYRIIRGIKERAKDKLPVVLHCHDMGGAASMCHLMALLAGVDMIDTVMSPLSFGSAHPATETMVAALQATPFATGIDPKLLEAPARITREIREKYARYETEYTGVNAEVLTHKIPGGMISNMVEQLKEAGRMDLMEAALAEVPSVEKDLGHPPLLTPSSQIVGVQAVLNVLGQERYKIITKAVKEYVMGNYGEPPGPVSEDLIRKVMGEKRPDYSRRAGDTADPADWDRAVKDLGPLAKTDEDVLLGVLFPMQAKEFLNRREMSKAHPPSP